MTNKLVIIQYSIFNLQDMSSVTTTYTQDTKSNQDTSYYPTVPTAPVSIPTAPLPVSDPIDLKHDTSRFELLVKQRELNPTTASNLKDVLTMCDVVLLCDDSNSMGNPIAEEGTDPFAPKRSTRWLELKKLASVIIEFVAATNSDGLDIYFLNRDKIHNINTTAGLQCIFGQPPSGGTPLISKLRQIYHEKVSKLSPDRKLLIIVITDGEPTDGSRTDLQDVLMKITNSGDVHVSFAECTDNADDMEYLDQWDGLIKNFDNTDDYREELLRVKTAQGPQFKFDYTDYVIKILLATFIRWYFNLDQVKVQDIRNSTYNNMYNSLYSIGYSNPYAPGITVLSQPSSYTQQIPFPNTYIQMPSQYSTQYPTQYSTQLSLQSTQSTQSTQPTQSTQSQNKQSTTNGTKTTGTNTTQKGGGCCIIL